MATKKQFEENLKEMVEQSPSIEMIGDFGLTEEDTKDCIFSILNDRISLRNGLDLQKLEEGIENTFFESDIQKGVSLEKFITDLLVNETLETVKTHPSFKHESFDSYFSEFYSDTYLEERGFLKDFIKENFIFDLVSHKDVFDNAVKNVQEKLNEQIKAIESEPVKISP